MVNIVAFPISSLRRKWLFHYQGENFKCIKIGAFPTPQDCVQFSSVQFSHLVMSNCVTPWTAAHQALLSITNSWSLLKLMSIESVMPSNHLICSHIWVEREGNPQDPFPSSSDFNVMLESGGVFPEYKTQKSICVTMHVQVSCTLFARLVLEPNCET